MSFGWEVPSVQYILFQDFTYLTVEMYDDLDETLSTHYPKCERFIDEGRRNGVVLVHW